MLSLTEIGRDSWGENIRILDLDILILTCHIDTQIKGWVDEKELV